MGIYSKTIEYRDASYHRVQKIYDSENKMIRCILFCGQRDFNVAWLMLRLQLFFKHRVQKTWLN